MFIATVMNVSQRTEPLSSMQLEPSELAALGANSGLFVVFKGAKSDFVGPFGYLFLLWLHKEGAGDLYVYVLFDDPEVMKSRLANAATSSVFFASSASPAHPAPRE